jgi:2-oxoglutarate ferredoxin oxidoreductase subunit gamma
MMQTAFIVAGFGGQGVLFAGLVLAYAGLAEGKQVTWIPSYGPEMRGGTANVTVMIGDKEIGSPLVRRPDAVLVLNQPSLEKYEPLVKPGGWLVYNSSLVTKPPERTNITCLAIPATEIAAGLGDTRIANMVGLGALVAATGVLPLPALGLALSDHLLSAKRELIEPNEQALARGARLVQPVRA